MDDGGDDLEGDRVTRDVLGVFVHALAGRLFRWLDESAAPQPGPASATRVSPGNVLPPKVARIWPQRATATVLPGTGRVGRP